MDKERWFWVGVLAIVMGSITLLSFAFADAAKQSKYCHAYGGIYYQFRGGSICIKSNSQIEMP